MPDAPNVSLCGISGKSESDFSSEDDWVCQQDCRAELAKTLNALKRSGAIERN